MAGLIPQEIIDQVVAATDIVDLVESYVPLTKKSAANYFGLCPFHSEDTPSFSVSPAKQIFYCFGCHKGGNAIKFIQEIESMSYPEAIRFLAKRAGIDIPEDDDPVARERAHQRKRLQAALLEAARRFYAVLQTDAGAGARRYLQRRGLRTAVCRKFGLGCSVNEWDDLCRALATKGFTEREMIDAGLARMSSRGKLIDYYKGRLMFPIFDLWGHLVAFGGRSFLDEPGPKYLNTPETSLYHKGSHLYGLNFVRQERSERLLLVEGYLDCISLHQAGFTQTAAVLGTALTAKQADLIRKLCTHVVLCFDSDEAGQQATLRSADLLVRKGLDVQVLNLPRGKDPDDFVREHGSERFEAALQTALPLLDYKIAVQREASLDDDGSLDVQKYQGLVCELLLDEPNAIIRELYAGKLAEELSVSRESVLQELERRERIRTGRSTDTSTSTQTVPPPVAVKPVKRPDRCTRYEVLMIAALASSPDIWKRLEDRPVADDFSRGAMQRFAERFLAELDAGTMNASRAVELAQSCSAGEQALSERLLKILMREDDIIEKRDVRMAIADLLDHMREDRLADQKALVWQKIGDLENGEEKDKLIRDYQVLSDAYNRHRQRRNKRNYNP